MTLNVTCRFVSDAVGRVALKCHISKHLRLLPILVAAFVVIGSVGTVSISRADADSYNTSVDFGQTTMTLATLPFSSSISTYNAYNTDITQDNAQLTALHNLNAGYYRIPLQWNNGNIISSAAGGPTNISGDAWISKIKQFGGTPEIIVGGSTDDNFTPSDAANLVQHFNKPTSGPADPVNVWVIGNEPDVAGMSIEQYCTLFNASADAMRAIDPNIQLAGPAWSFFDPTILADFLQCAGNNVNILDFHGYGMGESYESNALALSQTSSYQADVDQAYQLVRQYAPNRGIQVQVGEYNWSWTTSDGYNGWQGDDRFYQAVNTVWGASVAGNIAAAGGRGDEYADLNGALGLTFEQEDAAQHYGQSLNSPMPIYYGLEMFTGGNLFRGFGTAMVSSGTELSNVEIYAANNGNIVMINKDPEAIQTASINLTGFSGGSADVWQTNQNAPFSPPAEVATINDVTDSLSYTLPPYSVTTFVLNSGTSAGGAPTPTSTPSPQPKAASLCTGLNVQQGTAPGQYTFTAQTTAARGMTVTGYDFKFGDDTTDVTTQDTASHTYAPGTYPVRVSVDFSVDGTTSQITSPACETTVSYVNPSPGAVLSAPLRINVGGGPYTDPSGTVWQGDEYYSGGSADGQGDGHAIQDTTMAPLFQDERWGNFSYQLPIANGTYSVRLYFAETYGDCLSVGCRVFDVTANGSPWLTNYDIAAKVGDYTADVEAKTITVTNNVLNLTFTGVVGSPQLAAIEVVSPNTPETAVQG